MLSSIRSSLTQLMFCVMMIAATEKKASLNTSMSTPSLLTFDDENQESGMQFGCTKCFITSLHSAILMHRFNIYQNVSTMMASYCGFCFQNSFFIAHLACLTVFADIIFIEAFKLKKKKVSKRALVNSHT